MDTFFETLIGQPHSTVHSRVWDHEGAIVDIGCSGWDWPRIFIGKKRVVGVDPDLSVPVIPGIELLQMQLGPYNGVVSFQGATAVDAPPNGPQSAIWTWQRFAKAAIDKRGVAVLKINAEGAEWPLLASMSESDFAQIDQIAVSFHDFVWPAMAKSTKAMIYYLESLGYTSRHIYPPFNWWLFFR